MPIKHLLLLLSCFLVVSLIPSRAQYTTQYSIYFNTGSYNPGTNSKTVSRTVDSLNTAINKFSIILIGNTDDRGGDDRNYKLSEQRAMTIKNLLVASGINEQDIVTEARGESSPVGLNNTKEGRRLNRRVDMIIKEIPSHSTEKITPPEIEPEGNINELYSLLKTPPDEFCIDLTRDTLLVGKRGTIIQYKANTIKREGLPCKCFTLKLNEYFDKSDLLFNNLTTTSDGNLLESGGMIKLDGYCDGKEYQLKPGEFFTVMVPTDTILPGMKLLSANRNDDSEYLNWKLDTTNNSILDDFDWKAMDFFCRGLMGPSAKCPFFFCRIGKFFDQAFGGSTKTNKHDEHSNEESIKEKYILARYQLKGEELSVALKKSRENAGTDALKYYVYKNYNWDYRNIDRYKGGNKFINFIVENKPTQETDVKIIFKSSKTVVPCFERGASYVFKNINDNSEVWVIGLRYTIKKEIYLGIKEINTSEKRTKLDFKPVSVEELKAELKTINK